MCICCSVHIVHRMDGLCTTFRVQAQKTLHDSDVAFLLPCREGYFQVVQYLVGEQNCNKECTDKEGWTPLHWAVQ